MPPPASVLRSKLFKKTMLLADSSCFHEILWKWYFTKRVGIFAYKVSYSVYTYMILWYSLPSSNLKLAASSRLWAKMQGFSSYVVFFQKYTKCSDLLELIIHRQDQNLESPKGNFKNGIVSRQKPHRFPQFTLKSKHASFQSPQIWFDFFDCWWLVIY